jgi:uncharacterized protein
MRRTPARLWPLWLALVTVAMTDHAAIALASRAQAASAPVRLAPAARDSVIAAILRERAETEEWLRSKPTSYLATIQRRDFEQRSTLTLGRAAGNDLRIEDPGIEPNHLRVTVVGDSFRVEARDPGASFLASGASRRAVTLPPSSIGVGRYTVRLSHQRYPALIVFDPQSPRLRDYKGLRWFPVDLGYRYELPLTPNPRPDTVMILSTRGNRRRAVRVGWFHVRLGSSAVRLEATRLLEPGVGENDLGVFFRDATSGRQTYGLGRYVDPQPLPGGGYLLDFNAAYNPACAFSEHYNCPIPPRANQVKVAIRAGEMDSHYLEH